MRTNADYTTTFMHYGEITVPKGTPVTHQTAMGIDTNYHFVASYSWVLENYADIANILNFDLTFHGLDVPKEFIDYE